MDEDISSFLETATPFGGADLSTFTLIHDSQDGFCALYRGERAGQFRIFKCLKPQWRGQALQEAMLKKEFEIGYPLRHPGIRETYQYTFIEGLGNCIEMEWIDGMPLSEFLQGGHLDDKAFRKLAGELCDAISYIHSRQTLHRDIKPSNIMITHDGHTAKLIDFGLADSSSSALLKSRAGTVRYIAPEVMAGSAADVRSDLWSLGTVLREMSPARYRRALEKCISKDPSRRYRNVQEAREALLKRPTWPYILLSALLILFVAGILVINKGKTGTPDTSAAAVPTPAVADTIPEAPRDSVIIIRQSTMPKPAKAKTSKEEADHIFQQASDLFKGALD